MGSVASRMGGQQRGCVRPWKDRDGTLPQGENCAGGSRQGWRQELPIQQGGDTLARGLAGLPTHSKGTQCLACHRAEEGKECHEPAQPAHKTDGPLAGQLPEGHDVLRPVGRYVWLRALVEAIRPGAPSARPTNYSCQLTRKPGQSQAASGQQISGHW